MHRLLTVWDPRLCEYDFGPDHPFRIASREMAVRLLESTLPAPSPVDWIREVEPAPSSVLRAFHTEEYLESIERASELDHRVWLDAGDTPSFPGCYVAAARIVSATAAAVDASIERRGPAFQPSGGLHHARPDRASGFCIFSDVAIGIQRALHQVRRIAYIDIDAHHGDGVMYGFYDRGDILDIDFHQNGETAFPGTGSVEEHGTGDGAGLKVNVPLPPGAGDDALIPLFGRIVPPLLEEFRPGLIILQHGVDGHAGDPLVQLQYTSGGYEYVVRTLLELASRYCEGRLVVTGGGGYEPTNVALSLAQAGRLLAGVPPQPERGIETPREWRNEFHRRLQQPAPKHWDASLPLEPSSWNGECESELIDELSRVLGRRFPAIR